MTMQQKGYVAIGGAIGALVGSFLTWVTIGGIAYQGVALVHGETLGRWLAPVLASIAIILISYYVLKEFKHPRAKVGGIISGALLIALGVFELDRIQSFSDGPINVEVGPGLPLLIACGFLIISMLSLMSRDAGAGAIDSSDSRSHEKRETL